MSGGSRNRTEQSIKIESQTSLEDEIQAKNGGGTLR